MAGQPRDPAASSAFVPVDPYALARAEAAAARLKRFYETVGTGPAEDGGTLVLLDGRPARTPQRRPLALPTPAAAALVADEFAAQGAIMQPADMPVLRLVNAVIDGVAETGEAVKADIVRYASADLLLYRADGPDDLVARQGAAWDPVLAWAADRLGARFVLATGIVHVAQPEAAAAAVRDAVDTCVGTGAAAPYRLGALHVMTTLTGSALLALAVAGGEITAADAWDKAHLDEDFQIERWGRDAEAEDRRGRRRADMQAAVALLDAVDGPEENVT